jgi:hypothetical protein
MARAISPMDFHVSCFGVPCMPTTWRRTVPQIRENLSLSQGKTMNAVVEAKSILFAVPRSPTEKMGAYIRRTGAFFGLTFSQAKKIVYGEIKDMRASRLDAMRAKLDQLQEGAAKRRGMLNAIEQRRAELRGIGSRDPVSGSAGTLARGGRGDEAGRSGLGQN